MFAFTDEERARYLETGQIGPDEQGNEIFVGLTLEETAFCMDHKRRFLTPGRVRDPGNKKTFLELMNKHHLARYAVNELRNQNPTRH